MTKDAVELPAKKSSSRTKLLIAAVVIVGLLALSRFVNLPALLNDAMKWIEGQGAVGYVVFALLYIAACVFFLPGSVLTLGAGAVYGLAEGLILVSVSSTLGAAAAFLVGRYFARDWVAGKIEGSANFKAIDEAVGEQGWKIVGLTRLSPLFPFNVQNYAYGLTKVRFRDYFFASWVGMLPGTVMYVYIGSVAGSLSTVGAEESGRSPAEWALLIVGLVATVAVTVFVTRIAQKALKKQVEPTNAT